jgi:carboxyl-terminal processing protease
MNNFLKKRLWLILVGAVALIGFTSYTLFGDDDDFEIAKSLEIYHSVLRDARIYYVDDVDYAKLINQSTQELLAKLDPYTVYYPESLIEDYTFMTTGAYAGIGADIGEYNNSLIITDVYKNSPADKAGLKIGDKIEAIQGELVTKSNISVVKENVKGEPGSSILLRISRLNTDNKEFTVVREKIETPDVTYFGFIDEKIGYVKLTGFRQNAAQEVQKAIQSMNDSVKLSGLVLDMRGNPGGLLIEAVKIVNLFVKKNQEIVSTRGRVAQWNSVFKTENLPLFPDLPLVVLVNSSSASASEIVSGALQDLDRAVIVGERTYGKGLVQATRDLVYNTKIKITTAKYYIPSGRCVQALDYTHRNPDGSVGKVPDSLVTEYKTQNGRVVYDGGGVIPDVAVSAVGNKQFLEFPQLRKLIFDFSTEYYFKNETPIKTDNLFTDNRLFEEFRTYAKLNKFEYYTKSELYMDSLLQNAEKESVNRDVVEQMTKLKQAMHSTEESLLNVHKAEVSRLLVSEIVKRYQYFEGEIRFSFKTDPYILKGIELLKNSKSISEILAY